MTDFINPYMFVPLPQEMVRRQSPGHDPGPDEAPERYVGALEVTWHIQSPIATPTEEWGDIDGDVHISDNFIKGAVRSTHEMLFGGCLRQVDLGYRPTYRQLPNMGALKDWRMAVVLSEDEVLLREGEEKRSSVDSETLRQHLGGKARTGDVIAVNSKNDWKDRPERRVAEQFQVHGRPADASGYENLAGCYVALITKEGVRHETATVRGKKVRTKWYWSLGKLTRKRATISLQAKRDPNWAMVKARPDGEQWIDVFRGKTKLGQARGNEHTLEPGSIIWVKVRDGKATAIKLSQFWRKWSKECLEDRIPQETRPCDGENPRLCPSCSVFGSTDTLNDKADTDERRRKGDQRSYAAHARFGSAVGTNPQGDEAALASLGQPHLGVGLTYLEPTPSAPTPKSRDMRQSRRDSDSTQKRQLRGCRFYWRSNPEHQLDYLQHTQGVGDVPGQHLKREYHGAEMCTKTQLVTGGTFRQTITLNGLDQFGVASLLAALQPGCLLGDGEFALRLGRGKPLGLGSVAAEITAARTTTVVARYGDKVGTPLETFVIDPAEVKGRCGDLDVVHEGARKVLHLDGLGENWWKVTYPTCEVWQQFGSKELDESSKLFEDFGGPAKSDGKENASWRSGAWKPMPEITDHDQSDWSAK